MFTTMPTTKAPTIPTTIPFRWCCTARTRPRSSWRTTAVEEALRRIIENPAYAQAARELKHELDTTDGYRITGELIWELLDSRS